MRGHEGRLLVATPLIEDPHFRRTVVAVLQHNDTGAVGVILNRPFTTRVDEQIVGWAQVATPPTLMFFGGPVATDSMIGVAVGGTGDAGYDVLVAPGFGTLNLEEPPAPNRVWTGCRLFVGASGWTTGQLEDEIAEGAWWVVEREPGDVVSADPEGLWTRLVRRQPAPICWYAHWPEQMTDN